MYFQDLLAETLGYLVKPTVRHQQSSSVQSACHIMPVLSYHWCLTDLRDIDRQARKIVCESGGKHPPGLKATVYLPRALGGRGMRSVEEEYKMTKTKSAIPADLCLTGLQISTNQRTTRKHRWGSIHSRAFRDTKCTWRLNVVAFIVLMARHLFYFACCEFCDTPGRF